MEHLDKSIFIRAISKKDRHQFTIEWSDGRISDYRLSDVQRLCPCAACCEKKIDNSMDKVEAVQISSVGGYALQIIFTRGCSKGIYPFSLLRQM
jgi:ATP-binding protein involved in chromosome partitioning